MNDRPSTRDDQSGDPAPTGRRRGPRRRTVAILIGVLTVLLVVPAVVIGYALNVERSFLSNVNRETEPVPGQSSRPPVWDGKPVNFLLIGSDDQHEGEGGRADALMLVQLSGNRQSAYIVSFPRDLYVNVPGHGKNKINSAYSLGGPELAKQTVAELTGVEIDHTATIDMEGFVNLTTELGGVTVDNKHYSKSGEHEFQTGKITIEGQRALAYVRERKQLPRGDLDRAERQRQVVQAIISKGVSPEVITDPEKFTNFISAVGRNLTVDASLTDERIRDLALSIRMSPEDIVTMQVPVAGDGTTEDGQAVVLPDEAGIKTLSDHLRNDTMSDYTPPE
ncbi:LCP family protein [Microlunatus sp. Y2014]|uniref:LCP family protein n=1 Tax=Microlunatus sp. Y2014 TaxID=3418488 RepID=UPI003DA79CCF